MERVCVGRVHVKSWGEKACALCLAVGIRGTDVSWLVQSKGGFRCEIWRVNRASIKTRGCDIVPPDLTNVAHAWRSVWMNHVFNCACDFSLSIWRHPSNVLLLSVKLSPNSHARHSHMHPSATHTYTPPAPHRHWFTKNAFFWSFTLNTDW